MNYYISDTHFGHSNIIGYDKRPFPDAARMDETMIGNWNSRITPDDTVYILGDFIWKGGETTAKRLNGHKVLVKGNHDHIKGKLAAQFELVAGYLEIRDRDSSGEERLTVLSHYPMMFWNEQYNGSVQLYGHIHNTSDWDRVEQWRRERISEGIPCNMLNVGAMMTYMNYTPRTLAELLAVIEGERQ